jgi:hypothetical protein
MKDLIVLGGDGKLCELDRLTAYAGSQESVTRPRLRAGTHYPMGPQGSLVLRRIYVTLEWENGVKLTATPVVDGVELTADRVSIHWPGAGRDTFMLDLEVLCTAVDLVIDVDPPTGRFYLEDPIVVEYLPASGARNATGGS